MVNFTTINLIALTAQSFRIRSWLCSMREILIQPLAYFLFGIVLNKTMQSGTCVFICVFKKKGTYKTSSVSALFSSSESET